MPNAAIAQISATGDIFTVGSWDFKAASFSGVLNNTASDITVVDAGKTDYDNIANISTTAVTLEEDSSNFLIGTLYTAPGGANSLVNGLYSVTLGNTGTVTLPAGGTITEGYVTSNPTIQLTPASPDVASQKLVIKGGGSYTAEDNGIGLNWYIIDPLVGDTVEITVNSLANADQTLYWWIYPEGASIATPESGTVSLGEGGAGNFSFTVDSDDYEFTVRVSPEANNYDPATGVETQLFNSSAPTLDADHHLHLTTGNLAETSIFLGTDDHNVRTTTAGNIEINTPGIVTVDGIVLQGTGYTNGSYTAQATTGGSGTGLTVDYLVNTNQVVTVTINQQGVGYNNGDVITIPGGSSSATVLLEVTANNVWAFGTDGTTTFPTLTVPLEDNANPVGTGQVLKFSDSSQQAIIFGPVSTSTSSNAERVIIQGAPGYTGTSGEGGDVYVWAGPGGSTNGQGGDIKVRAGQGIGSGNGGYLNFQAGDSATGDGGWINIESGYSNTQGQGGDITVWARRGGEIVLRTDNGTTNLNWTFGADGNLTLPKASKVSEVTPATGPAPSIYPDPSISSIANEDFVTTPPPAVNNYTIPGTDIVINMTFGANGPNYYGPTATIVNGGTGHTSDESLSIPYADMGIDLSGNWPWFVNTIASNLVLEAGTKDWTFGTNGALTFPDATVQTTAYTGTAATATSASTAASIGYIGMPQNSKSANYELVIGDMGKHIYVTATSTVTVPSYTSVDFPIGTTIAVVAGTGATVSIAITTDTMNLAGPGTTGTRTLAPFGMATLVKVAQSTWFISGVGLT